MHTKWWLNRSVWASIIVMLAGTLETSGVVSHEAVAPFLDIAPDILVGIAVIVSGAFSLVSHLITEARTQHEANSNREASAEGKPVRRAPSEDKLHVSPTESGRYRRRRTTTGVGKAKKRKAPKVGR